MDKSIDLQTTTTCQDNILILIVHLIVKEKDIEMITELRKRLVKSLIYII
jgi:hypothetical protein